MKSVRNCVEIIILLIVIGAATFSQRFAIVDWFRVHTAPPLPPAVEFESVIASPTLTPDDAIADATDEEIASVNEELPRNDNEDTEVALAPEAPRNNDELPASFNLAVPFTPQAPHGNWSEPYKEACEEASLYMVYEYYRGIGEGLIAADTADAEIKKIVAFEMQLFGAYEDTTAEETGTLAEMMYGYENVETIDNPTVEQIKTHVVAGHPVIVPVAGRLLGNPYFTAPGPIYHMFVVRGYTADEKFITNDPGTRRGEAYVYDFDTLMNAMHDWNSGEEITDGKKVVLVIYP